jgi:hypothetical protein
VELSDGRRMDARLFSLDVSRRDDVDSDSVTDGRVNATTKVVVNERYMSDERYTSERRNSQILTEPIQQRGSWPS